MFIIDGNMHSIKCCELSSVINKIRGRLFADALKHVGVKLKGKVHLRTDHEGP
jgi:hypothetical protein